MERGENPGISPEAQEELRLFELIWTLQHHVANAQRYEERLRIASLEARQPLSRTESFVVHNVQGNHHAPAGHDHIILVPESGEPPVDDIVRVDLRVLERVPLSDPQDAMDTLQWNDVFLGITTSGGTQDFLVNGFGIQPFLDAETDVKVNESATGLQPDLYIVSEHVGLRDVEMFDISALHTIMDTYVYKSQRSRPNSGLDAAS